MKIKDKIEKYFGMTIEEIIFKKHLDEKISLNDLSKECGVIRQSFTNIAKKLGLEIRSVKEATRLTRNKGENHFNFGNTKLNNEYCLAASNRMKTKNPTKNVENLTKAAATRSEYFKTKPWPPEIVFIKILNGYKVEYIFQHPIRQYIIDFFIPEKNICVEIDSTKHWGLDRREAAKIKDKILFDLGFKVVRICKSKLTDLNFIADTLKSQNII